MLKQIPFLTVVVMMVSEFRMVHPNERSELVELARTRSKKRIQKFAGWAFLLSLVLPFSLVFFSLYIFGFFSSYPIIATGLLAGAAALLGSLLNSVLTTIILAPEIRILSLMPVSRHNKNC